MSIPPQLEKLIRERLEIVKNDPSHSLLPKYRLAIYQAMKELNEARIDKVNGWLAIITARKVLHFWEAAMPNDNLAPRMLEVAEGLFQGTMTLEETDAERETFYHIEGHIEFMFADMPGRAGAAMDAAYTALITILEGRSFGIHSPVQLEQGIPDELIAGSGADVPSAAVLAYSGYAYDDEILIKAGILHPDRSVEVFEAFRNTTNPDFNPAKRLEFWEWWLTEAIPQAWELGKKQSNAVSK